MIKIQALWPQHAPSVELRAEKNVNSNRVKCCVVCRDRNPSSPATECSELRADKAVNSDCVKHRHVVCRIRDPSLQADFKVSTELRTNF